MEVLSTESLACSSPVVTNMKSAAKMKHIMCTKINVSFEKMPSVDKSLLILRSLDKAMPRVRVRMIIVTTEMMSI